MLPLINHLSGLTFTSISRVATLFFQWKNSIFIVRQQKPNERLFSSVPSLT